MSDKRIIVVLGMHRSGTSALARGLLELGVGLGNRLIGPLAGQNEKGFWEDAEINDLNGRLLALLGLSWDSIAPIDPGALRSEQTEPLRREAVELLVEKAIDCPLWSFKDPRTSRVLPFWQTVFDALELVSVYLIALRNPLSVARSLAARDGFPTEKAALLWLQHTVPAVRETAGARRLVVDYDRLIDNPVRELLRVADTIPLPRPQERALGESRYVRQFLSSELRHSTASVDELAQLPICPELIRTVYDKLLSVASDTTTLDALQCDPEWRRAEAQLDAMAPLLRYLDRQWSACAASPTADAADVRALAHSAAGDASTAPAPVPAGDSDTAAARGLIEEWVHALYTAIPIAPATKLRIKSWLFAALSPALRNTRPYREWVEFERKQAASGAAAGTPPGAATEAVAGTAATPVHCTAYEDARLVAAGARSDAYLPLDESGIALPPDGIKVIAFYLPQFHPIPLNDEAWGKGFTEWTNVTKAVPQFLGHYQPRLPGELGFYDLRLPQIQQRQIELARLYGVYGFCFHFYWFDGTRLLDRPLTQFLADESSTFPFCICWANENWTRRWDGKDDEVLLAQRHSPDSDRAFLDAIAPILSDRRYLRIAGKPLLIVYRPELLANPRETVERWRTRASHSGLGELHLAAVRGFGLDDPTVHGFDSAIEFPPLNLSAEVTDLGAQVELLNRNFRGAVYDYRQLISTFVHGYRKEAYPVFRAVCPDWDNEARRPGAGTSFAHAAPDQYRRWLTSACAYAASSPQPDQRLVFVNAWNEWAEGAYLEPDRRYGYAYLDATRTVVGRFNRYLGKPRLAVWLHLSDARQWPRLRAHLYHLPEPFDLAITVTATAPSDCVSEIRQEFPAAAVHTEAAANPGDAPHRLRARLESTHHDYVCSLRLPPEVPEGTAAERDWQRLLDSPPAIDRILRAFFRDPALTVITVPNGSGPDGTTAAHTALDECFAGIAERVLAFAAPACWIERARFAKAIGAAATDGLTMVSEGLGDGTSAAPEGGGRDLIGIYAQPAGGSGGRIAAEERP